VPNEYDDYDRIQIKGLKYDILMRITTERNTQLYSILMCHLNPENINQTNSVLYTIKVWLHLF